MTSYDKPNYWGDHSFDRLWTWSAHNEFSSEFIRDLLLRLSHFFPQGLLWHVVTLSAVEILISKFSDVLSPQYQTHGCRRHCSLTCNVSNVKTWKTWSTNASVRFSVLLYATSTVQICTAVLQQVSSQTLKTLLREMQHLLGPSWP